MNKAITEMNGKNLSERPMRIKKAVKKERLEKKFKKITDKKVKMGRISKQQVAKGFRSKNNGKGRNIIKGKGNKFQNFQKKRPNNNKEGN